MPFRSAAASLVLTVALFSAEPNAATKRWWAHTTALANDGMGGRDTGSDGYNRAAAYVASHFARLGLEPAGTLGYFQAVPLKVTKLDASKSVATLSRDGVTTTLAWFRQVSVPVRQGMPTTIDAPMVFVGTELPADLDLKGKAVVTLGTPRFIPEQKSYSAKVPEGGQIAAISIPSTEGGPEPSKWPVAYSVSMSIDGQDGLPPRQAAGGGSNLPAFSFNSADAELLFAGSGHTFAEVLALAKAGKPVPSFPLPSSFRANLKLSNDFIVSDNIIGVLPGSDPVLKNEYVVVSAHLDGYGFGEPWKGDKIYNGAFDDAAYVATLLDMAEQWKDSKTRLKRSILFCVVTGEEKGLLGSRYFVNHPTIPIQKMVANVNLDILRPIFPLKILTVLGLDLSTLGESARKVAEPMGIRIQPDPEPLRGLWRRSDHYSFIQTGVPAIGFVFGYEKGSPEEVIYRKWYAERYHTPADDLNQPWLPDAAAKFNTFYRQLVETVANDAERPQMFRRP
jgi:hypothetical protein